MNIIISTRKIEKSATEFKNELESRLQGIEEKYQKKLTKAEAIIEQKNHNIFFAEVVLHGTGINIDAKAETSNMYESIALVSDRLEVQLHKVIKKKHNHR